MVERNEIDALGGSHLPFPESDCSRYGQYNRLFLCLSAWCPCAGAVGDCDNDWTFQLPTLLKANYAL